MSQTYRKEIDGLRAIAIAPVVLFHAGITMFRGGYVGVDVFFVISGYLITRLILNEMAQGTFRLRDFYARRIRRIVPALLVMVACCIPFAWIWLAPTDMNHFAQSILAVVSLSSNVLFWQETDYFDQAAELKPLLHTWSLAVEEQYYLLFPLLLMGARRVGKWSVQGLIWILLLGSFAAACMQAPADPQAAFYLLHARGWEILLGAVCALYGERIALPRMVRELGGVVGLGFIGWAVFMFDAGLQTLGSLLLIPTLGTVLVILCGGEGTLTARLLRLRPLQALGLMSYSLYLWHYPVMVFMRFGTFKYTLDPALITVCIVISLLLARASWRWVETPFRNKEIIGPRPLSLSVSAVLALVAGIAGAGYQTEGLPSRFDKRALRILNQHNNKPIHRQHIGDVREPATVMLLGDSYAESLEGALYDFLWKHHLHGVTRVLSSCPPALGIRRDRWKQDRNYCNDFQLRTLEYLKRHPEIKSVIISAHFSLYLNSTRFDNQQGGVVVRRPEEAVFEPLHYTGPNHTSEQRGRLVHNAIIRLVTRLSRMGKKVFVISSVPEVGWDVPYAAFRLYNSGRKGEVTTQRTVFEARYDPVRLLMRRLRLLRNVTILMPSDALCDARYCFATRNQMPYYYDENHLNRIGAKFMISKLFRTVRLTPVKRPAQ